MKPVMCLALGLSLGAVAVPTSGLAGEPHQQPKRQQARATGEPRASLQVTFSAGDAARIIEHCAPQYRDLPRGLQKKLRRTGHLPPGWEKRFEPFPLALERKLAPLPNGYRRGVFEGQAVLFDVRTHVLLDVVVLF